MILTLARKELSALFRSPLAWVVLALFQLVLAYVFLSRVDTFLALQPRLAGYAHPPGFTEMVATPTFSVGAIMLLMGTPLLSMRLIAGERRDRTLPLLFSSPLSMTEIVLGKFLGLWSFLALLAVLPGIMALALYAGGKPDLGLLAANLLGSALLAAAFAAFGLYFSALAGSPTVAGALTMGGLLGLWVVGMATPDPDNSLALVSPLRHFDSFSRGLTDTADVAYFLLFSGVFLLLAIRRLDGERLGGEA